MTTQRFALEPNGPLRLTFTWSPTQQAYQVDFDGQRVGEAPRAELRTGKALQLPNGSTLNVRSGVALGESLELTCDGRPLKAPTNWPPLVKNAGVVLWVFGAISLVAGLTALSASPGETQAPSYALGVLGLLGGGAGAVALGALYLACSAFSFRRHQAAMWTAGGVMLLDTALTVGAAVQTGQPFVGGLLVRLVLVAAMVRGLQAVHGLKRQGL